MNEQKTELNEDGKVLGMLSIFIGWAIPIVGVILGVIGYNKSKEDKYKNYNKIGIVISIISWIITIFVNLYRLAN